MTKSQITLIWIIIGVFVFVCGLIRVIAYGWDIYPVKYPRAWYDSDQEYFDAMKKEFPKWKVPEDYKPTNKTSDELMFADDSSDTDSNQLDANQHQIDSVEQQTEIPLPQNDASQSTNYPSEDQSQIETQDTPIQQIKYIVEDGKPRFPIPNTDDPFKLIPVLVDVLESYYEEYAHYIQTSDYDSTMLMVKGLETESNDLCNQFEGTFNSNGGERNPFYDDVNASLSSLKQTINQIKERYAQKDLNGVLDQMGSLTDAKNYANYADELINPSFEGQS